MPIAPIYKHTSRFMLKNNILNHISPNILRINNFTTTAADGNLQIIRNFALASAARKPPHINYITDKKYGKLV